MILTSCPRCKEDFFKKEDKRFYCGSCKISYYEEIHILDWRFNTTNNKEYITWYLDINKCVHYLLEDPIEKTLPFLPFDITVEKLYQYLLLI